MLTPGGLTVEGDPPIGGTQHELVGGRVVDPASHRLALLDQADGDRPFGDPLDELTGAVDRIDDPDPFASSR